MNNSLKVILDLGCGFAKTNGAIGVERALLEGVDIVTELDSQPYPFADNSIDEIHLNDVIEHLPNTIKTMEEIYRIMKPGGHIFIRVIDWSSSMNADDPQHITRFTQKTFNYFGTYKDRMHYSTARYKVNNIKITYNPAVKRYFRFTPILRFLSTYLNNIIDGLHFDLVVEKNNTEKNVLNQSNSVFDIIRCPWCVQHRTELKISDNKLQLMKNKWLICKEPLCQRKFPIVDNTPIINSYELNRWISTAEQSLPSTLTEYHRVERPS